MDILEDGLTHVPITDDRALLREAIGFLSGKVVYANPTNHIVVLDKQLTLASVRQLIEAEYDEHLEHAITARLDYHLNKEGKDFLTALAHSEYFRAAFECRHLPAFSLPTFVTRRTTKSCGPP